ncbi:uncharacterized protein [Physcomitrium patens]|uniref:Shugoshin C-terminal domain-containing protein n=1 Tax=Physcomitrium patens TaxID=3218 RepID=A0A7I4CKP0_PHYPA|nr:shugoshin-1-like isoform X2 [Physcomitrium patens]|eukprot:XP_024363531.1 shugoshin-1-like isoform X2 [Physcomitrella patens]
MAEEKRGRKALGTTPSLRHRLSNITNLVNSSSWSNENEPVKNMCSNSELQLQQEIKKLLQINAEKDVVIAEKDQGIESQRLFMFKIQRDFYTNICKRSQQNEEIVGFNTRLSKELSNVRDQLKLLHHEYTQMTLVYRLNKSELEMRLTETQEQLKRVSEEMNLKASYDLMDTDKNSITTTRRTTNSSAQRRSMINDIQDCPKNTYSASYLDTTTVTSRGSQRQRTCAMTPKDGSLRSKTRQDDGASLLFSEPSFSAPVSAPSTKRFNNRYGHLNNLEPMQELSEEFESQTTSSTISCRSRSNPFLEYSSSQFKESETANQLCHHRELDGEVSPTDECNAAEVNKSSDRRLATAMHKNSGNMSPPPARPNTPKRSAASHPSSSPKRNEIQTATKKKSARQPSVPGSTYSFDNADTAPSSGSSLSRTQVQSPRRHKEPDHPQPQPPSITYHGGRPSRRATESVISYKEPSLVSKMRRPH